MPTPTAQQIIAAARRNAANLPSEQAAARALRNEARRAARQAREAAKPVRAARELPPIDGAHWVRRRYGSNWIYPAVQISSPHGGPEPTLAREGWYVVRTKYGLRAMQPAVFQRLYVQYAK